MAGIYLNIKHPEAEQTGSSIEIMAKQIFFDNKILLANKQPWDLIN